MNALKMQERMPEYIPKVCQHGCQIDRVPDRLSEKMPDRLLGRMPDRMSEYMSDRMPSRMSD